MPLLQPPGCRPKRLGRLAERGLAVGAGESFPPASQQFVQVSFQGSHSLIIRIKMRLLVLFAYAWECLRRGMATVCGPRMKSQAKFVSDAKSPISPRTSLDLSGSANPRTRNFRFVCGLCAESAKQSQTGRMEVNIALNASPITSMLYRAEWSPAKQAQTRFF